MNYTTFARLLILSSILILTNTKVSAQKYYTEEWKTQPWHLILSGSVMGTSGSVGVTMEARYKAFGAEFGMGFIGMGAGLLYYPAYSNENWPHIYSGIKALTVINPFAENNAAKSIYYVPIGFYRRVDNKFNYSVDIGPALKKSEILTSNEEYIIDKWINLYLNFSFGVFLN